MNPGKPDSVLGAGKLSKSTRRVILGGQEITVTLEVGVWEAVDDMCEREAVTVADVLASEPRPGSPTDPASCLLVTTIAYFQRLTDPRDAAGHQPANPGANLNEALDAIGPAGQDEIEQ